MEQKQVETPENSFNKTDDGTRPTKMGIENENSPAPLSKENNNQNAYEQINNNIANSIIKINPSRIKEQFSTKFILIISSAFALIILMALIILIIHSSKKRNNNSNYKSNDKIIISKNLEKISKNKIIGLHFGTSTSGYYILENNEKNRTDSFPSELILDEDSERGLFYGNKAHSYPKNDLAKQKKLYFSNFKRYIDPFNDINKIKSDFPDNHEVKLEIVIDQFLSLLKEDNLNNLGDENNIKWILTVPGLWDDKGKQLMKDVSNKIGMKDSEIILEQEASSLAFLYDETINSKHLKKNKAYIVVDAGFTSVDICVNKIIDDKQKIIKQLMQPLSFRYGSNIINDKIIEVIESVCEKKMEEMKNSNFDAWQIMLSDIELKKKLIDNSTSGDVSILTPFNNDKWNWAGIKNNWEGKYKDQKIIYNRTNINIPSDIIKSFIKENIVNIIKEIETIIDKMSVLKEKIELIIITGGFSSSKWFQNEINDHFNKAHFISFDKTPIETVMKGAAIYGLRPNQILYRVSPVTIGIGMYIYFEDNVGKCEKQLRDDEENMRCFKFITLIQKGQEIKSNNIISAKVIPWEKKRINISFYSTFNDNLTVNDCYELKEMKLDLTESTEYLKNREIEVSLSFSNQVNATISEKSTSNKISSSFYYPS